MVIKKFGKTIIFGGKQDIAIDTQYKFKKYFSKKMMIAPPK